MKKILTDKQFRLLGNLFICLTLATRFIAEPFLPSRPYKLWVLFLMFSGILFGLYRLIQYKNVSRSSTFLLSACLPVACALSLLMTNTYTQYTGIMFVILGMYLTLLFLPLHPNDSFHDLKHTISCAGLTITIFHLPFQLISLYSIVSGRHIPLNKPSHYLGIIQDGLISDRIRVIFHPNTISQMALILFCFCVWYFMNARKVLPKVFAVLAACVQVLVITHAQSRTVYICLALFTAVAIARAVAMRFSSPKVIALVGISLSVILFFLLLKGMQMLFNCDIAMIMRLASDKVMTAKESYIEASGQFDVDSSLRVTLWKTALSYLKNHPTTLLTGTGAAEPIRMMLLDYPEIDLNIWGNLHNAFLASLFRFGILYFLVVVAMLVSLLPACIRCFFRREDDASRGLFLFPLLILVLLIASTMEEKLFFPFTAPNITFYLSAGIVLAANRLLKKA